MAPTLAGTLIGLVVLSLFFWVFERFAGHARAPLFRRGWWTDAAWWVFTPLVVKAVSRVLVLLPFVILIGLGVASAEGLRAREYAGFGPVGAQPIWLQFMEVHVLADLIAYWTHRKFHGGRWWPFHAVHHSSEDLDWLSSVRVHPVNSLALNLIQAMPLVLVGFNPFVTLSAAPVFTFYAILLHARVNWTVRTARPRHRVTGVPSVASLEGARGRRSELCRAVLILGRAVRHVLSAEGSRAAELRNQRADAERVRRAILAAVPADAASVAGARPRWPVTVAAACSPRRQL